jgi:hypothetical protein
MYKKIIIFVLDSFHLYNGYDRDKYVECYSYFDTEEAINHNANHIITYDIGHLSFDLEDLGYTILIGYKGACKRFYTGMSTANGKELRHSHNLRRILIGGALDNDLHIERNKFYYDMNKSTSELLADQLTKEKFDIMSNIFSKTIGADIEPVSFDKIGDKINSIVSKATNQMMSTNGANGLTKEIKAKYESN